MSQDPTRELLQAVIDALTLPYGVPDYDARIVARAAEVHGVASAALAEDPADLSWYIDYLRRRMAAEEAAAAEQGAAAVRRCLRDFAPSDPRFDGQARYRETPWCRMCVDNCHDGGAEHVCRICDPARYGGGQ